MRERRHFVDSYNYKTVKTFSIEPMQGINVLSIEPMRGIGARGDDNSARPGLSESLGISGFERVIVSL